MTEFNPHKQHKHSKCNYWYTRFVLLVKYYWFKRVRRSKVYFIKPWISMNFGRVEHNNWGDELNVLFLPKIAKSFLLVTEWMCNPFKVRVKKLSKYRCVYMIGSVLHLIHDENSIVWGSGIQSKTQLPNVRLDIRAVRGPLTRELLIQNGYECPVIYGDPAMLLPYYYVPKKRKKRYKIGIVPHYTDYHSPLLDKFKMDENVLVIPLLNYKKWTEIIDGICSCDVVYSSSLHGLIVAEAYGIPNVWIEIGGPIKGDVNKRFKFHDFFCSIGMDRNAPFLLDDTTDFESLVAGCDYKKAPGLSVIPLVKACPFILKEPLKKFE